MNEQLQEALALLIGKTTNGIEAGAEFLTNEIPDVVQQLLLWYGVQSAIVAVLGVILLYLSIFFLNKMILPKDKDNSVLHDSYGFSELGIATTIASVLGLFIGFPMSMQILETIQIYIAPKIWLIEYVANLAK